MRLDGLLHCTLHIVLTRVAAEEDVHRERTARDLGGGQWREGRVSSQLHQHVYTHVHVHVYIHIIYTQGSYT